MKKRYYDFLTLAFIGILFIFSVIKATLVPMRVPVKMWHMLLFATGALIFYCLVNTKVGRIVFLSVAGAGLCLAVFFVFKSGLSNLSGTFTSVIKLINVIIQVGTGYYDDTIPVSQLFCAVGVYSLIVALPVYFFLIRRFRFYILFTPGLIFFMTVWGLNRHVDKLSFYIFIAVAIVCYIRHIYLINSKNNRSSEETLNSGSMLIHFMPIALVVILVSTTVTVSEKPIEWPWLDNKIYNLWWDMQKKLSVDRYDTFSLAKTGFGNPSRLGGPVHADNTPILFVNAPTRVYLRGAVYDSYTGAGWQMAEKSGEYLLEDRIYDHTELTYGWKATCIQLGILSAGEYNEYLLNGEVPSERTNVSTEEYLEFFNINRKPQVLLKLFPKEKITVQHLNVRTKSLFTPLKLLVPITGLSSNLYKLNENAEGIFQSDRRLRGRSTYYIEYLQPAYGMKEIENFFNLSKPGLYSEFNEYLEKFIEEHESLDNQSKLIQQLTDVQDIYKQLEGRKEEIYRLYTNIPEEIPERVIELAKEITSSSNTTYAKVKNLETYLRQNYHYTLNPSYPPLTQDFVDYFLFDGKEGYCSYFASALCVMTRAIGIPSRYVEGFLLPEKSGRDNSYQVTNQNAHAWVEVYLEGVGWVTFEPTPPMANAQNYYVSLRETGTGNEGFIPEIPDEYEQGRPMPNVFIPEIEESPSDTPVITINTILLFIIAFVLVVLIMNLLFILVRRIILNIISPKKSILLLYRYAVSLLSQAGSVLQPGQTPKEYAQIVDRRYSFNCMSMSEMVELYYSVRFGSCDVGKKTLKRVFSFVSEIKSKTGRDMYFMKKLLYRYLLFKG